MDGGRRGSRFWMMGRGRPGGMRKRHMIRPGIAHWSSARIGVLAVAGLAIGLLCWTTVRPRPVETLQGTLADLQDFAAPDPVGIRATEGTAHSFTKPHGDDTLRQEVISWIGREHPDVRQYAEYLAGYICLLDRMLAVDSPTPAEVAEMLSLYRQWIRAADANGDGSLLDDWPGMTAAGRYLTAHQSPHVRSLLDANQDGALSGEEWARVSPERLKVRLLGRVAEREWFAKWDKDGDGALSLSERAEGDDRLASFFIVLPDGDVRRRLRDEGSQSAADQAVVLAEIAAKHGASAAESAREALARRRFERLCNPHIQETGMPDLLMLADTVAGTVGAAEAAVTKGDSGQPQAAIPDSPGLPARESARDAAERAQMLVGALTLAKYSRYEADGNGRLDEAEWEARMSEEAARRAAAVRQLYCDSDGDGTIGDLDIMRFMEWLSSHSPRADINGDGSFDSQDLQQFMDYYGR